MCHVRGGWAEKQTMCGVLSVRAAVPAAAAFGRAPSHARRDAAWSVREQREGAAEVVEIRPEGNFQARGTCENSPELAAPARRVAHSDRQANGVLSHQGGR